jgi:hypothetical protein
VSVDRHPRVRHLDVRSVRQPGNGVFIVEQHLVVPCFPTHGTVHRAAVQMPIAERGRDRSCDRALAGS